MKRIRGGIISVAVIALTALSGCSRASINAQVADVLGTSGMYENNAPVESPKMKAERELREVEDAKLKEMQELLDTAEELAKHYDYEGALAKLDSINEEFQEREEIIVAKLEYKQKQGQMVEYEGEVPHIFFQSLIVDTNRAFGGDGMAGNYASMITISEFNKILEAMYANGYVLLDIHELVTKVELEEGGYTYMKNNPLVPDGKIPFVLSIEDVNYYDYMLEAGFARSLVLDENGDVKNLYIDADGEESIGDYDVMPLLDAFVEKYPDFSLRGAKGIAAITGYEGAFGYRVNDSESLTYEADKAKVKDIADRLRETGWWIASHSYSHGHMKQMGYDNMVADTEKWLEQIGSLVGETDILMYPYGEEVDYPSAQLDYLTEKGFTFLCGLWANQEFLSVQGKYVRQTRRSVDGYALQSNPDSMRPFFNPKEVIDSARPALD